MNERFRPQEINQGNRNDVNNKGHERWSIADKLKTISFYTGAGFGSSLILCGFLHSLAPNATYVNELCLTSTGLITTLSAAVGISESFRTRFS